MERWALVGPCKVDIGSGSSDLIVQGNNIVVIFISV